MSGYLGKDMPLHPCASNHTWYSSKDGKVYCRKCGTETLAPPPPPPLPLAVGVLAPDPVAAVFADEAPALTVAEVQGLLKAARWGLLRSQNRLRVLLLGKFSMRRADMVALLEAASAVVVNSHNVADVLIQGDDADAALDKAAMRAAAERGMPVWTEQDLVLHLVPTIQSLTAVPPEAPF